MKRLFTLLLLITAITESFAQEKLNYSGVYTINKSDIDFNGLPDYVLPTSFKVIQDGNKLTTTVNTISEKGVGRSFTETIVLGGDSVYSIVPSGLHRVAIAVWNNDKRAFTIRSDSRSPDHTAGVKMTEVWSLTDDGKALEIDRDVLQANGFAYTIKGYYDRTN